MLCTSSVALHKCVGLNTCEILNDFGGYSYTHKTKYDTNKVQNVAHKEQGNRIKDY